MKKAVVEKKRKTTTKPSAREKGLRPGSALEQAVARIQQKFLPDATISTNEKLIDRFGIETECDVVFRGTYGAQPVLGVMECRDRSRPVEPQHVNAFANKTRNLNAHFRLMVSSKGFSKTAIELAKKEGVGTYSLIPTEQEVQRLNIGVVWYLRDFRWTTMSLHYDWDAPEQALKPPVELWQEARWQGKLVRNYFVKLLATKYNEFDTPGEFTLRVKFDQPQTLAFDGQTHQVVAVEADVISELRKKRKGLRLFGDGFLDWGEQKLHFPADAEVVTESWKGDFSDWDDYEGDIPAQRGGFCVVFSRFMPPEAPADEDVPDWDSL